MNTQQTIEQIISYITTLTKVDVASKILEANTTEGTNLAGDGTRTRALGTLFEEQVLSVLINRFPDAKIYSNVTIYFKYQAPGTKKAVPTTIELDFVIVFNNEVYLVEAKRSINEELLASLSKKVGFFHKLQESEQDLRNLVPTFAKKKEIKNLSVTQGKSIMITNDTMVEGAQEFLDEVSYFQNCKLVVACRNTNISMNYGKASKCVLAKSTIQDPLIEDIVELDTFKRYYSGLQKIVEEVQTCGYEEMFGNFGDVIVC